MYLYSEINTNSSYYKYIILTSVRAGMTKTRKNKEKNKTGKKSTTRKKGIDRSSEKEKVKDIVCNQKSNGRFLIGTSGFMVSQKIWLNLGCLNCIEINSTFYRLPSEELIEKWRTFPDNVSFVIKASKYITHIKRLHDVKEGWEMLWRNIRKMGNKLHAVLFQLPPSFSYSDENMKRIEKMHSFLPSSLNVVFEFRDKSWLIKEVYEKFKKMRWCISGTYIIKEKESAWMGTMPAGFTLPPRTASFNYLRIHGNRGYKGSLTGSEMKGIVTKMERQGGDSSFVMFNNAFFDPRSKYCSVNNYKIRYAGVCNAVELSSLV